MTLSLLNVLGMTVVMPVLPFVVLRYLPNQTHLALWVGLLEAANSLCAFLAAPFLGALSDRWGRRPVIVISAFGAAIGFVVFGVGGSLWVLLLGRIIQGATAGDMPAIFAYVADITPSGKRAQRFGMLGAVSGAGFMVGPALGGLLAGIAVVVPAFVTAGICLLVAITALFVLPESRQHAEKVMGRRVELSELLPLATIVAGFRRHQLRPLLAGFVLIVLPFMFFTDNTSVLALDSVGWGPTPIGVTTSAIGVLDILVQGVLLRLLLKPFGERGVILAGVAVQALGSLALAMVAAVVHQPWLLVVGMLAFGAGEGGTTATLNGVFSAAVSQDEQGWMAGITQGLQSGLGIVAPLLVGVVYTGLGHSVPYWAGAAMLATAGVILARAHIASPSRPSQTGPEKTESLT